MGEEIDIETAMDRLLELAVIAKEAERGYAVRGDIWWWQEEPPTQAWEHQGLLCAINAGSMSNFNGYVQLPEGHPWQILDLQHDDGDIEVHGGITFGPHASKWIGFDTNHAGDSWDPDTIAKAMKFLPEHIVDRWRRLQEIEGRYPMTPTPWGKVWTMEALKAETEHLAEQVKAAW